jgi:hypothetical protein
MVETVDNFVAVEARWRPPSGALREPSPRQVPFPTAEGRATATSPLQGDAARAASGAPVDVTRASLVTEGLQVDTRRRRDDVVAPTPPADGATCSMTGGERGTKRAQPFGPSADSVRGFRRRWLRGGEATDIGGELAVACSLVHGEVMRDATESGLSRGGAVEVALRPRGPSRRLSNAVLPLPPRSGGRGSG